MPKYVIIGNSAGAIGAAEAIREVDPQGSLTIVSEEPHPAYSRPLISEFLCAERTLEKMLFRPQSFYQKHRVEARLGQKALRLDLERRQVEMEGGDKLSWEKLLLATGGTPIVPPTPGTDKKGVFTFTTLADAEALKAFLPGVRRAVVIGGGLIGMSVTEALRKCEVQVTVVELLDRVLGAIMDEPGSRMMEKRLREHDVNLCTGLTVKEVLGQPKKQDQVGSVTLSDDRNLPCDALVIAIGVRPRTQLATGTAIKVNRGIVVDARMATSVSGVYACGDVAEAYDYIQGEARLTPIWPNAHVGGLVAGRNMAGKETAYPGGTNANSLKYFGLPVASAGLVNPPEGNGYQSLTAYTEDSYKKVVLKGNRIVGLVLLGDIQKSGLLFGVMREGLDVSSFKEHLLSDSFGLSHLPEAVRRSRLEGKPVLTVGAR
ncbi:MAG: NAD(P)/FAD-dependent oxidoreductase [Chloroflexi bacterium]|nr:NAD(P)/FAD-dependent oxidoreductase [Chloroflexota bacterium]